MTMQQIAQAVQRVEAVLHRRPHHGLQDDAPASAEWRGGARVSVSHPNGIQVSTDMPAELGGTGDQATPGWLFRAGLASCAATSIVLAAAAAGVELTLLHVEAESRSDTRGLLGLCADDDLPVYAGPGDVTLGVRIAAPGADAAQLRALVDAAIGRSPVPNAVTHATAIGLRIDIVGA